MPAPPDILQIDSFDLSNTDAVTIFLVLLAKGDVADYAKFYHSNGLVGITNRFLISINNKGEQFRVEAEHSNESQVHSKVSGNIEREPFHLITVIFNRAELNYHDRTKLWVDNVEAIEEGGAGSVVGNFDVGELRLPRITNEATNDGTKAALLFDTAFGDTERLAWQDLINSKYNIF